MSSVNSSRSRSPASSSAKKSNSTVTSPSTERGSKRSVSQFDDDFMIDPNPDASSEPSCSQMSSFTPSNLFSNPTNIETPTQDLEEDVSPLQGFDTLLRMGFTQNQASQISGVKMELVITIPEGSKPLQTKDGFYKFKNEVVEYANEKGKLFFKPDLSHFYEKGKLAPVLVTEIKAYNPPGELILFGKVSCYPDITFLYELFKEMTTGSNLKYCPNTFSSHQAALEFASPYFAQGAWS